MEGHTCYFHPREVVIGICALCLNERLVVLAASRRQERRLRRISSNGTCRHNFDHHRRNYPINLPKIFALSSLLSRLDLRPTRKTDDDQCHSGSSGSQEESFISIKFGDNGAASWEKSIVPPPKVSLEHYNISLKQRLQNKDLVVAADDDDGHRQRANKAAVIEHPNVGHGSLQWRKKIGHIFQLSRWRKSSSKGAFSVCHVRKKLDGVKLRHGWITSLTKMKRTKE